MPFETSTWRRQEINRISFDEYFGKLCKIISLRASCPRASVGSLLVLDHTILSSGYNGAPSGADSCDEVGCVVVDNHCLRSIHSETNSVGQAAKNGIKTTGSTLYYYDSMQRDPCQNCLLVAISAGVVEIVKVNEDGFVAFRISAMDLFNQHLVK